MTSMWEAVNAAAAQAVAQVHQSVVQIRSDGGGIGAGTIWHSDGLIVTSAHVVVGKHVRQSLEVVLYDGTSYPAQVLAYDTDKDLAALHIAARDLPALPAGVSAAIQPGMWLMALGHPWGVRDALTAGIVIGTGRNLPEADQRDWLALDMKMRPGHSGGPLFNTAGQLVGINTMIRGPEVSFAVPVDVVKVFLQEALGQGVPIDPPATAVPPPEVTYV